MLICKVRSAGIDKENKKPITLSAAAGFAGKR